MKNLRVLTLAMLATMFVMACEKEQATSTEKQVTTTDRSGCTPTLITDLTGPGGNVECSQVGDYEFSSDRFSDGEQCSGTVGPIQWTTDASCTYVSWTWIGPGTPCGVAVIVKGGNAANVYVYPEGCTSGSGLVSPQNMGGQTPNLSNITFCWNVCPDEQECTEETAFGGNTKGGGPAWWYYFDTNGPACQKIYAGQKEMVGGSVCYNAATDELTITLGPGWSLQNVSEPVKIQGYGTPPSKRPAAGLFTTYKGTSLGPIKGNNKRYYVVHLDVQYCE